MEIQGDVFGDCLIHDWFLFAILECTPSLYVRHLHMGLEGVLSGPHLIAHEFVCVFSVLQQLKVNAALF